MWTLLCFFKVSLDVLIDIVNVGIPVDFLIFNHVFNVNFDKVFILRQLRKISYCIFVTYFELFLRCYVQIAFTQFFSWHFLLCTYPNLLSSYRRLATGWRSIETDFWIHVKHLVNRLIEFKFGDVTCGGRGFDIWINVIIVGHLFSWRNLACTYAVTYLRVKFIYFFS